MDGEKTEHTKTPATGVDNAVRQQPKSYHVIPVPFVHQCYNWDCGLACVAMVLKLLKEPCDDIYTKDLDFVQCGESVWTIDLAYILHRHSVALSLYTITLGVHDSHKNKIFYKKSISEDSARVQKMFEQADEAGVVVEKRSVTMEQMVDHVDRGQPIIVLVNDNLLHCIWCHSMLKQCLACLTCTSGMFQGHYVVMCGFDRKKRLIYYRNPGCNGHDQCCMEMDDFDRARVSDGTDEDIVFIHSLYKAGIGDSALRQ